MNSAKKYNIPITKQTLGQEELALIAQVLESGWVVQGPKVKEFEAAFSSFCGSPYSAATTSCTTALHIAVAALSLKPGDEVIVPAFTWIATANVVEYMGAKPIFCDIDLKTFNIDPDKIEKLITPRTVGIIPVHLFGLCADMPAILDIAKRRKLWVVEDAACGFGAAIEGQHAGTFGEFGCFSFHPRKAITTGEGGMITTARPDLDKLARSLRDHGASQSDLARHQGKAAFLLAEYNVLGYNFRMTDMQGAMGVAQMKRAPELLAARGKHAEHYHELLSDIEWLNPPAKVPGYRHGYQAFVCLFNPEPPTFENVDRLNERRNAILTTLEDQGISTRQGTHAPVILGYYVNKYGLKARDFPNAYLADRLTITLPLYPQMTATDQSIVVEALKKCAA